MFHLEEPGLVYVRVVIGSILLQATMGIEKWIAKEDLIFYVRKKTLKIPHF